MTITKERNVETKRRIIGTENKVYTIGPNGNIGEMVETGRPPFITGAGTKEDTLFVDFTGQVSKEYDNDKILSRLGLPALAVKAINDFLRT